MKGWLYSFVLFLFVCFCLFVRLSRKRLGAKVINRLLLVGRLYFICLLLLLFFFFCFSKNVCIYDWKTCYYSPHHRPNNVAFGFRHDDVHNKGCHHDENILNPRVIPCKHNKQNSQDANKPESQDAEQRPQCHRRKVVLGTEISKQ